MGMFTKFPAPIRVKTKCEAEEALHKIGSPTWLAFDTETTGTNRTKDYAVILTLADDTNRYCVWPETFLYFRELLQDARVNLIGWMFNFDAHMLHKVGINIYGKTPRDRYRGYDARVMHALWCDVIPHTLKYASRQMCGVEMLTFDETFRLKGANRGRSLEEILLDPKEEDRMVKYATLDAWMTYVLFVKMKDILEGTQVPESAHVPVEYNLWKYFEESEVPLTKILWEMECRGVLIDTPALQKMSPEFEARMQKVRRWFGLKTGQMLVNPNSDKEMRTVFFDDLGYEPIKETESGLPSLAADVLEEWAVKKNCEYAKNLLEFKGCAKKLGTFVSGLLRETSPADGCIHTTYDQAVARTGRLSSKEPNLQNLPPWVRAAIIAHEGYHLVAIDYRQLEMRILAHLSGDENLISSINGGMCVHCMTASIMFGASYDEVEAAKLKDDIGLSLSEHERSLLLLRKIGKAIGFGLAYGKGPAALGKEIGCSTYEAKNYVRKYFSKMPRVRDYFDNAIRVAKRNNYSSTLMGRRRTLWMINSMYDGDVAEGERKIKNSPIQGTAQDIVKWAMKRLHEDHLLTSMGSRLLLQIHDELVWEVPSEFVENDAFVKRAKEVMCDPFGGSLLSVALDTSHKYGKTLLETK